jgi:hypothetical protein
MSFIALRPAGKQSPALDLVSQLRVTSSVCWAVALNWIASLARDRRLGWCFHATVRPNE